VPRTPGLPDQRAEDADPFDPMTTLPPAHGLPELPDPDRLVAKTAHGSGKFVALTFDDGPNLTWTPQFLELLATYRARATFCLIGKNVERYPDLVQQIAAAGDALCDHTMTHDERLPWRPEQVIRAEIAGARQVILDAAPTASVMYYRAPGGFYSRPGAAVSVQKIAVALGMQPLLWSVDTRDWARPGTQAIVNAVEHRIATDDVILMHDGGGNRSQTLAALRILLPWLVANGYQFDIPA